MSKTIAVVIAVIIVIIGLIAAVNFNVIPRKQYGPYDDFIICLKVSGAKLYGDYTRRESLQQMSLFGDSLYVLEKSGVYIECNQYGADPQLKKCKEANLRVYPTWIINGKIYPGIYGLNKLSELTGCKYER